MKKCGVCNKEIKKFDLVSIMSYPVECVGFNGEYDFLHFLKNERVIHYNCFGIKNKNDYNKVDSQYSIIKKMLIDVKEEVDEEILFRLCVDNKELEVSELFKLWFRNKQHVV